MIFWNCLTVDCTEQMYALYVQENLSIYIYWVYHGNWTYCICSNKCICYTQYIKRYRLTSMNPYQTFSPIRTNQMFSSEHQGIRLYHWPLWLELTKRQSTSKNLICTYLRLYHTHTHTHTHRTYPTWQLDNEVNVRIKGNE